MKIDIPYYLLRLTFLLNCLCMDIASQIKDFDRSYAMPQSPFSKGISTVAGLGSSLLSAAFNHKLAERSAKAQYDRQLSFWEKQNAYNHPAAQRRRLEAAGFNAVAASGQIAGNNQAGGLSSVPGNEYAQGGVFQQETFSEALRMFAELRSVNLDNENTRRQIQLSYLEELLKKGELAGVDLSNQEKSTMLRYLDEAQESNLKLMFEELRNRQNDNHRKEADNAAYDEYRAAGGNQYTEAADESRARVDQLRASLDQIASDVRYRDALTATEDALRSHREQSQILSNAYQSIRNGIESQYGGTLASLDVAQRQAALDDFIYRAQEYVRSQSYRDALLAAGVSESRASARQALAEAQLAEIKRNNTAALVGSGSDWYSPIGAILMPIFGI